MKKFLKKTIIFVLAVVTLAFTGCGRVPSDNSEPISDGKTVNVKISKAGYGTTYIYKLADRFNELYKEEGYKINVLYPQTISDSVVVQDIYDDKGIDLYFVGGSVEKGVAGDYGHCYADITDLVFNQKPIRFDGTEEDTTVAAKIENLYYDTTYEGKYYALPYAFNVEGMCVNVRVLKQYGKSVPRTTNELFDCVETIMKSAAATDIFPVTYSLSSNNYPYIWVEMWLAQYMGYDGLTEFWTMQKDGKNLEKPYEVFALDGIEEAFTEYYRFMDYNTAAFGSSTQTFKESQNQFMQGDAVFYASGDWTYNEEKIRNKNKMEDVICTRVPVASSLAVKFFGGNTAYGLSDEKCEEVLVRIIDGLDAGKTADVITAEINSALSLALAEKDVEEICRRASYVASVSFQATSIISEKSEVKDIAALFLRMVASDDGAKVMTEEMMCSNPFDLTAIKDLDSSWHRAVAKVVCNPYMKQIPQMATGYRRQLGITRWSPYTGDRLHDKVLDSQFSIYDNNTYEMIGDKAEYARLAKELSKQIYDNAKKQWESGIWG